jgi:hypothetical protein
MTLEWFDTSEAAKIGVELADQFARQQLSLATQVDQSTLIKQGDQLRAILQSADREVRPFTAKFL